MAIKKTNSEAASRENKFDQAVAELNSQEENQRKKSDEVVRNIAGRNRKKPEERKAISAYIPVSLWEQFDAITSAYGISNNAAICTLIKDYVREKKSVLDE